MDSEVLKVAGLVLGVALYGLKLFLQRKDVKKAEMLGELQGMIVEAVAFADSKRGHFTGNKQEIQRKKKGMAVDRLIGNLETKVGQKIAKELKISGPSVLVAGDLIETVIHAGKRGLFSRFVKSVFK